MLLEPLDRTLIEPQSTLASAFAISEKETKFASYILKNSHSYVRKAPFLM